MQRVFTETLTLSLECDTDAELGKITQGLALSGIFQSGMSHAVMPSMMRQIFAEMPPMQIAIQTPNTVLQGMQHKVLEDPTKKE